MKINCVSLLMCILFLGAYAQAITVTGPVQANAVNVTGSVFTSSVTVGDLIISNSLNINGANVEAPGKIVQMKFSSSTVIQSVSSTTYVGLDDFKIKFTLINPQDYIRISLTGVLSFSSGITDYGVLTIKRGIVDLGNTSDNTGLSVSASDFKVSTGEVWRTVGVNITDSPGDTMEHVYQVFIRTTGGSNTVVFPHSMGYFILEEVSR
jgi:hypothetical protein